MRKHRRRSERLVGRYCSHQVARWWQDEMSSAGSGRRSAGMASEDAALQAGMSQPVGSRLFRRAGRMPAAIFRPSAKPLSGRYLSFAEREEIALLRVQGCSMREVARRLGRAASTISRELRRNAATRSGGLEYRATTAQWHAENVAADVVSHLKNTMTYGLCSGLMRMDLRAKWMEKAIAFPSYVSGSPDCSLCGE